MPPPGASPALQPTALALPLVAGLAPFTALYEQLTSMSFYNILPNQLTEPQNRRTRTRSRTRENLATVLRELKRTRSELSASPPTVARHAATSVEYRRPGLDASTPARWTIDFNAKGLTMISRWSQADPPEPIVLEFNPKLSRATLLGMFNPDGSVPGLPAILHLPDQGTVRITAADTKEATLGYDAQRTGAEFIRVVFPPATEKRPQIEYRWQVVAMARH